MKTTKARRAAKAHRSHHEATVESFRRDPKFAAAYLNAVLDDGDRAELMTALRYVTEAFGGCPRLPGKRASIPLRSTAPFRRGGIRN